MSKKGRGGCFRQFFVGAIVVMLKLKYNAIPKFNNGYCNRWYPRQKWIGLGELQCFILLFSLEITCHQAGEEYLFAIEGIWAPLVKKKKKCLHLYFHLYWLHVGLATYIPYRRYSKLEKNYTNSSIFSWHGFLGPTLNLYRTYSRPLLIVSSSFVDSIACTGHIINDKIVFGGFFVTWSIRNRTWWQMSDWIQTQLQMGLSSVGPLGSIIRSAPGFTGTSYSGPVWQCSQRLNYGWGKIWMSMFKVREMAHCLTSVQSGANILQRQYPWSLIIISHHPWSLIILSPHRYTASQPCHHRYICLHDILDDLLSVCPCRDRCLLLYNHQHVI